MKGSIFFILIAGIALWAQDSSVKTTTAVDINGNRVGNGPVIDQTKTAKTSETTERMRSINGQMVPLERVEEHVLRDDASGKVVERVIHRFDATGQPAGTAKETIETQKRSDGSSTTQATRYQSDINGSMRLVEKATTDVQKSGSTETSQTVVQRPTVNGSLDTVEKKETVRSGAGSAYREDSTTYRRDGNGGFNVALRDTVEHTEQNGETAENTAHYEVGAEGRLQLHNQSVSTTVKRPDGSKESVVNLFGLNVPGTNDPTGKLKLYEQQVVESKPGAGNTVVETLSVRRPSTSDPKILGPERQVSQTVCKGKCSDDSQ